MENIVQINEVQYADMFLNEERHYPKFLDKLKMDVTSAVDEEIDKRGKDKQYHFNTNINIISEYCDEINIDVTLNTNADINDKRQYHASYYNANHCLQNGKLICPQLSIVCPYVNRRINGFKLYYVIAHELTHLYDDWKRLKCGKDSILLYQKNVGTISFLQEMIRIGTSLTKGIGMLSYLSLKVERQAFLSQTVQELKALWCTQFNYRDKLKETVFYGNLIKSYSWFCNGLNNISNKELIDLNRWIINNFPNASIPKYDVKIFNAEQYRQKLMWWADKIYHQTMKKYGSVVSYYVDELEEEWNKHTSMFII
jgi:hypothetical protein